MRKLGIIIILFWVCISVFAQNDYYMATQPSGYLQRQGWSPLEKKIAAGNHVKMLIQCHGTCAMTSDSIDKIEMTYIYLYDTFGNLTGCTLNKKHGKQFYKYEINYNSSGYVANYKYRYKHSKKYYSEDYTYDKLNQVVIKETFNNDKSSLKYVCTYDSNKIVQMQVFKKGRPYQKWMYKYYPDGKNEETKRYDGKGHLKYTWSFACRTEGEKVKKMKDSTLVCRKDSHNQQGNRVEVYLHTNEKGKTFRRVYVYNPDTVLRESIGYDDNGHIHWRSIWNGPNLIKEYIWYRNNSEKIDHRYLYDHNEKGVLTRYIEEIYRCGKIHKTKTSLYSYLREGLRNKIITVSPTKKHREISLYNYTFFPR